MNRWTFAVMFSTIVLAGFSKAEAGRPYPPKRVRGSYAEYIKVKQRDGQIKVREVYTGYKSGLGPPAIYYYGYPHAETPGVGPGTSGIYPP